MLRKRYVPLDIPIITKYPTNAVQQIPGRAVFRAKIATIIRYFELNITQTHRRLTGCYAASRKVGVIGAVGSYFIIIIVVTS